MYKIIPFVLLFAACSGAGQNPFDFTEARNKLEPLHEAMGKAEDGDWLAYHEEPYVSFEQYRNMRPVRPSAGRNKIYMMPLGRFDAAERSLLRTTAVYLRAFYGLEVKALPAVSDLVIPAGHRRFSAYSDFNDGKGGVVSLPDSSSEQLHTRYILNEVLRPIVPGDAAVVIALCDKDLYPDPDWNFVFGQALLRQRVGVWSFWRFGNLSNPLERHDVLRRTLKTASHETGHMFSVGHCTRYHCIMNGSNHLSEADRKPTYLCPDCLEKLCWNLGQEPVAHFKRMLDFWRQQGDSTEVRHYQRFIRALGESC